MKNVLILLAIFISTQAFASGSPNRSVMVFGVTKAPAGEQMKTINPPEFITALNAEIRLAGLPYECKAQTKVLSLFEGKSADMLAEGTLQLESNCLDAAFHLVAMFNKQVWSDGSKKYTISNPIIPLIAPAVSGGN